MPPPDSELARWFATEIQPHEAALRAWLKGRFPGLVDGDDVIQDAYTRLLKARGTGPIASAKAFLYVTARNLALNRLRHQRHACPSAFTETDPSSVIDESAVVTESVTRAEDLEILIEAIQSLPDRCRQILTLRKIYGLSQREVAERLGISEHTVETQGAIGLRKCVEFFRSRGYERTRPTP